MHHPIVGFGHRGAEFLGKMRRDRVMEHGGAMGQFRHLCLHGGDNARMAMADADTQVHAQQVDQPVAVLVPKILHLATFQDQRRFIEHKGALRGGVMGVAPCYDGVTIPLSGQGRGCVRGHRTVLMRRDGVGCALRRAIVSDGYGNRDGAVGPAPARQADLGAHQTNSGKRRQR